MKVNSKYDDLSKIDLEKEFEEIKQIILEGPKRDREFNEYILNTKR